MRRIDIEANVRTETGRGPSRRYRAQGEIPAILYGPKTEPISLTVPEKGMTRILSSASSQTALFNLTISGGEGSALKKTTMVKEVQWHPIGSRLLHVDFFEVQLDKMITVDVPVRLEGSPKGVQLGGVLEQIRHEITISCLPTNIPEAIIVDTSDLDIGEAVHVADIDLGEGREAVAETNFTIATVVTTRAAVEAEEEAEAEEETEASQEGGES